MSDNSHLPQYDCMVLSGGGAKGAYGAGVAKALEVYRARKRITNPICYIGASAGALNAYILAAYGPDALIRFWRKTTNQTVLGTNGRSRWKRLFARLATHLVGSNHAFSVYDNHALKKLVSENAHVADLKSPLIIAVTDFTTGRLKAFYHSSLIERIVAADAKAPANSRRLSHLRRIDSDELLVSALMASAAIPVFFPPVEITAAHEDPEEPEDAPARKVAETSWFVDGGVGNNTPTREAAYFFRYLSQLKLGREGTLYCIKQDPPRVFQDGHHSKGILDIIERTLEVYNYVHTKPIVDGYTRISREVERQNGKVREVEDWLDQTELEDELREKIKGKVREKLGQVGGHTARLSTPFFSVEPSTELADFLEFGRERAETDIMHGYSDGLKALRLTADPQRPGETLLNETERDTLVNRPIW